MRFFRRIPLQRVFIFLDMLIIFSGLTLSAAARSFIPIGKDSVLPQDFTQLPLLIYFVGFVCWESAYAVRSVYDPVRNLRWYSEALRILEANILAVALLAGFLFFSYREISRLQIVYAVVFILIMQLSSRALTRIVYRAFGAVRSGSDRRILILGAGEVGRRLAKSLQDHSIWGFHVVGFMDDNPDKAGETHNGITVLGAINQLPTALRTMDVDEIWITLPLRANELVQEVVKTLDTLPVRIYIVPDYFSLALVQARAEVFDGIPVIGLRESVIGGGNRRMKRFLDILISAFLLILLSPLFAAICLAILLSSGRPVFFRQQRVGENLRIFDMFKFRTMVQDAEAQQDMQNRVDAEGNIIHKFRDDVRVTKVGRFLRRFSMDELPQLLNVLLGDMSLVGPRPEMPWLVDKYESWQRKRFAVPQGISGWWQINERSDKPMHLNTEFDLYYVYNYSVLLDLYILLRTPLAVLRGVGAF